MNRRRSLRVLLGVVLAFGVRAVVAAPAQMTSEMRAVTHCAGHMQRPVSVPESRRCCHVSSEAGAPAALASVPAPPPVAAFVIATLPVLADGARPALHLASARARGERDGPPIWLELVTVRC